MFKTTKLQPYLLIIVLFLLPNSASLAQNVGLAIQGKIDSIVDKIMIENKIVGLSIGIVKDNTIFYTKGYGTREINTTKPIDQYTNFLTSSISKLFTATAIMQLVEKEKIDLKSKLTDYIPDFEMKDERYKEITIEQMLTHTSGLPNIWKENYINPSSDSFALSDFARKLKKEKLSYRPGVQLSSDTYSNTAYNILGLVIERITNQTFDHYVTNNVLVPAKMDSSRYTYKEINDDRLSQPHVKNNLTGKVETSNYYPNLPQDKPCGNLNSCSYDMCQWIIHNLSIYNGNSPSLAVLSMNTLTTMWTTQRQIPTSKTSIGLGWWIVQSDKYGKYVFHVGNDPGFSSTLIISPDSKFGIVVLCNARYPQDIVWNKIPYDIMNILGVDWRK